MLFFVLIYTLYEVSRHTKFSVVNFLRFTILTAVNVFLGKLDSVLNSNSKNFSLFFNQSKGNIRARQIADVPRQILFSYELNLTV